MKDENNILFKKIKNDERRHIFRHTKINQKSIFNYHKLLVYQSSKGDITFLKKIIHQTFIDKYKNDKNCYNTIVIDYIMNNESAHIVAAFKEYLIYDDDSEYLLKYYIYKKSKEYLKRLVNYYENSSIIFPNYIVFQEKKYIYNNIKKKQKVIDSQKEQEDNLNIKKNEKLSNNNNITDRLFNTNIINSILGQTNTSDINKLFGINNKQTESENSNLILENIMRELNKNTKKKKNNQNKINIIKKNNHVPSLTLNISKNNINNKFTNQKSKENENIKTKRIKKDNKLIYSINSKPILDNNDFQRYNETMKRVKTSKKENENINIPFNKKNIKKYIVKSRLKNEKIDGHKNKSSNKEKVNKKNIFFIHNTSRNKSINDNELKNNKSENKFLIKGKRRLYSGLPTQNSLSKITNKTNDIYIKKPLFSKRENTNKMINSQFASQLNISKYNNKRKVINIKEQKSTENIKHWNKININNHQTIQTRKIIRKILSNIDMKNINEKVRYNNDSTKESNINININTLSYIDNKKSNRKIYFTINPSNNNLTKSNKIKYITKNASIQNNSLFNLFESTSTKSYKSKNISKKNNNKINKNNLIYKIIQKNLSNRLTYNNSRNKIIFKDKNILHTLENNSLSTVHNNSSKYNPKSSYRQRILSKKNPSISLNSIKNKKIIKKILLKELENYEDLICKTNNNNNQLFNKNIKICKKKKNAVLPLNKE